MTGGPDRPLVTVGVPVRNGAATLRFALTSILEQTYANLDVVIVDNASDDATPQIAAELGALDARVRVVRHPEPLTMWQNWRSTFEQCRGTYFLWAADDDLLGPDYVERLVQHLERFPDAGVVQGAVVHFSDYAAPEKGTRYPYDYCSRGMGGVKRLLSDKQGGYGVVGLWRPEILSGFGWWDHTISPDWPLIVYVLLRAEMDNVPDVTLYRHRHEAGARDTYVRAERQSYSQPERFPTAKLAWRCGLAADAAARSRGSRRLPPVDACFVFAGLLWANRRHLVRYQYEGMRMSAQRLAARRRERGRASAT
jgi:glycosyltransferase involved in cell wall biosynthesis